jgi:SAM-dependent methyltransferase
LLKSEKRLTIHLDEGPGMTYADPEFWNRNYRGVRESGAFMGDRWTAPFLVPLQEAGARRILDLGCGTGNEALSLLQEGFDVVGLDYSSEAIGITRSRTGSRGRFLVADMAKPLPFPDGHFDAVMSNVAAHMFSDAITRSIFSEVRRIVRPNGLFLFHLNSLEDRPLRAKHKRPIREMEPDYILEEGGQTMHFFSRDYLLELLKGWRSLHLEPVEILKHASREQYLRRVMEGYPEYEKDPERLALIEEGMRPVKRVWRGIVGC